MSRSALAGLLALAVLAGCREPDRPFAPETGAVLFVDSDPAGATVTLDGEPTGVITPDTLRDLTVGDHLLVVELDTAGAIYGYAARVNLATTEQVYSIRGPLILRCATEECLTALATFHSPNSIRFASNPSGSLLSVAGQGGGILWPGTTGNSYASMGAPLFAGVLNGRDTVAVGPYDWEYLAGRPAPTVTTAAGYRLEQSAWLLPPSNVLGLSTIRGIAVEEEVVGRADVDNALLVRLTFRNVTADPLYRLMDPAVPQAGLTFEAAYVGFGLDGDVGNADDDLLSYAADLNLAFMYDANFREEGFGGWTDRPALIGVRVLEAPPGTTVYLNAWRSTLDWTATFDTRLQPMRVGWQVLSGASSAPNHPDARIGFVPDQAADMRVSVSAGPLRLAPGEAATLTLAVVLAEPAAGTFTSGQFLAPGDPADASRALARVAAPLFDRARAAEALR